MCLQGLFEYVIQICTRELTTYSNYNNALVYEHYTLLVVIEYSRTETKIASRKTPEETIVLKSSLK